MRNKELSEALREYFKKNPDYVRQPVWDIIKSYLVATGRWKNLPRGNDKKGFREGWGKNKFGY